jgi:transcriptional regulator with XRE-family HTH domain
VGWSRELLAHRSGLSWAAISQIESGRRQDVRLSSLVALADALGVSVDYLVGGGATVSPKLLGHRGLIYGSDDEYLAGATPFAAEGIERGDVVVAITASRQTGLLRDALGDLASQVEFQDSAACYRSPNETLTTFRSLIKERFDGGAHWIRVIGEPVWAGRSDVEVAEWTRYESMINLSFASSPVTFICPYDRRSLSEGILAGARHTHPDVSEAGTAATSPTYREPEEFLLRAERFDQ